MITELYTAPAVTAKGSLVRRTLGASNTASAEAGGSKTTNDTITASNSTGAS